MRGGEIFERWATPKETILRKTERMSKKKRCKIQWKAWTDWGGGRGGSKRRRERVRYECQRDTNNEWSAEERRKRRTE